MNVLIACEESQTECLAFRVSGHNAFSADIKSCSGGYPQYHIKGDALDLLRSNVLFATQDGKTHFIDHWDLLIAHPPCTYLTKVGSALLYPGGELNLERYALGIQAAQFFYEFYNAPIPHICIENPVPNKCFNLPPYTQIVQPFYFGHPCTKTTCYWLKNLPMLYPTDIVEPLFSYVYSTIDQRIEYGLVGSCSDRAEMRSKSFVNIANAMAFQWGDIDKYNLFA